MLKDVHEFVKNSAVICGYHAELFISYPFSHAVFFFPPKSSQKLDDRGIYKLIMEASPNWILRNQDKLYKPIDLKFH